MKYTLLGTGRMARFIAGRNAAAGWECLGIWGRAPQKAALLTQIAGGPVLEDLSAVSTKSKAILLALADNALGEVAEALPLQTATLVHFSGTLPLEILLPHPNRAVCWPVYSIAGEVAGEVPLPFAGESSSVAAAEVLAQLAGGLGGTLTHINAAQRSQLHLAAVLANNFTNHLLVLAGRVAAEAGLPFELLQPIIAQTAARAAGGAAGLLQTGPAVRGDSETEAAHLRLLAQHPEWVQVYEALSASIKTLYKQA